MSAGSTVLFTVPELEDEELALEDELDEELEDELDELLLDELLLEDDEELELLDELSEPIQAVSMSATVAVASGFVNFRTARAEEISLSMC